MTNVSNEAQVSFRLLSLDKFQAYSLVREIISSSHQLDEDSNSYIASIPLTKQNFEEINDYFIRQRIELEACDILISVNAHSNTGSVNVPTIVNRMLKYIDCKLTFAFNVVN